MNTYRLTSPELLNPHWLSSVSSGQHTAVVDTDGLVPLNAQRLAFRGDRLEPGTVVQVWLSGKGFFVCALASEVARADAEWVASLRAQEEAEALQRQQVRLAAEQFNASLGVPVPWDAAIKDVLSGLTEASMGLGRNRSTVEHILLRENLAEGRLVRVAGDFLCTAVSGSNGKNWSQQPVSVAVDAAGNRYKPAPTCKACLRIAARWSSQSASGKA